MDSQSLLALAATGLIAIISVVIYRKLQAVKDVKELSKVLREFPEPAPYIKNLAATLPDSVLLPKDTDAFGKAMGVYFSVQNREMIPSCIVQPRDAQELSAAVKHIKREHADRKQQPSRSDGLFAIRGGGANPALGISGVKDGVVIDLSRLREVTPSDDGSSVTVGGGAYWRDVYKTLDERGLGVVGGRSWPVGVGGSTLQGTW
jgi:FAD/FMN-containing dehydrogenase